MDLELALMTDFIAVCHGAPPDPEALVDGTEQIVDGTEDIYDGS